MKTILTIMSLVLTVSVFAQAPQKMSYQAVIRDVDNTLITNQAIGMEISIIQGSISGSSVYAETQTPVSNANGLVTLEIGTGTLTSGSFSAIDWGNGPYFIQTQTDPTGGTNYTITGTSELLSVPYALHASVADSIAGGTPKHYVGELFGGGIVFFVWANGDHGLIASLDDLGNRRWDPNPAITTGATDHYEGSPNTANIMSVLGNSNSAAKLCDDYTGGGFTDWYLPSIAELKEMDTAILSIHKVLSYDGDSNTNPLFLPYATFPSSNYWSSTERDDGAAFVYTFSYSGQGMGARTQAKNVIARVRAIRAF